MCRHQPSPHSLEVFCFGGVFWGLATRYQKNSHISFYRRNQEVMKHGGSGFNDLIIYTCNCTVLLLHFFCCHCLTASICSCLGDILSGISSPILLFPHFLSVQISFLSVYLGHLFVSGYTDLSQLKVA